VSVALLLVVLFGAPPVVAGLLLLAWGVVWGYLALRPGGVSGGGGQGKFWNQSYGMLIPSWFRRIGFAPFLVVWFAFCIWIVAHGL